MRYFTVTYVHRPNGKFDEVVDVVSRLRNRDLDGCNVILDFAKRQVVKARLEEQTIDRDWDRIVEFYRPNYPDIFESMDKKHAIIDALESALKKNAAQPRVEDVTEETPVES